MRIGRISLVAATAVAVAGALAAAPASAGTLARAAAPAGSAARAPAPAGAVPAASHPRSGVRAACGPARPGFARCYALWAPQRKVSAALAARAAGKRVPRSATTPRGWGATSIESAYKLPVSGNPHATVAVVDAYSTPRLAADLGVYRKQYGLPPCGAASGCLRIVNQHGQPTPLPRPDPLGWGVEETLDVAMVSAACPHCHILVVEARSASLAALAAAENTAVRLGAVAVSNSYGSRENGFTQVYSKSYDHPGHTIVVATGDFGFTAAAFPANLATVTSVGGTELARAANARGWKETVWINPYGASGSGCSAYVRKPSWQQDRDCPGRTVADVAALAWNIALYDSSVPKRYGGPWLNIGGTSASSPLIAGVYALAGNATTIAPGAEYTHPAALYDITVGNNDWFNYTGGATCGYDYLCVAKNGYDAPTGLGTPDGTGDF